MGRGARKRARELEESRRAQLYGQIQREIGEIPPDLTPEQRAGITRARMGGIDIGYGNIMDEAKRRYSRTGSRAAAPELALEIGRERTREKSRAGAELEGYFAEVPVRRRLARAGAYTPLYQGGGQLLSSLYSRGPSTLDRILGAGAEVGAAAISKCWIAEELYGAGDFRTWVIRHWLNDSFSERWIGKLFNALYSRFGQSIACAIRNHPFLRKPFRILFDRLLNEAISELTEMNGVAFNRIETRRDVIQVSSRETRIPLQIGTIPRR